MNEPWSHGHRDIWREKIGDDYPFIAAKAARDANPDAALIFNDYDNHLPTATADEKPRSCQPNGRRWAARRHRLPDAPRCQVSGIPQKGRREAKPSHDSRG
ncbi:MAG: endo-1,4-beta-xylanase [Dehalococcoidia bacterium]|nr:endo-1,4-beta-xylanase [Dehalococcoidia bacterium]